MARGDSSIGGGRDCERRGAHPGAGGSFAPAVSAPGVTWSDPTVMAVRRGGCAGSGGIGLRLGLLAEWEKMVVPMGRVHQPTGQSSARRGVGGGCPGVDRTSGPAVLGRCSTVRGDKIGGADRGGARAFLTVAGNKDPGVPVAQGAVRSTSGGTTKTPGRPGVRRSPALSELMMKRSGVHTGPRNLGMETSPGRLTTRSSQQVISRRGRRLSGSATEIALPPTPSFSRPRGVVTAIFQKFRFFSHPLVSTAITPVR
jgi:hypothetical protein